MNKATRKRLAVDFGRALMLAQAAHKPRHSVQKTHDVMEAKGFDALDTRTIQRHQKGEVYPPRATRVMYAEIYPVLQRFT